MTKYAGPTTEILLRRVRQEGNTGTSVDLAMQILSHSQRIANAGLGRVKTSGSFSTAKEKLIYAYRDQLTDAVDIVSVKDGTRTLQQFLSLSDIAAYDPDWFRKVDGTQHNFWLQLGRDLLIIYPALATTDTLTVEYTKLTTSFADFDADYNTAMELVDEDIDYALGIAEVILLMRSRQFTTALARAKGMIKDIETA